MLRAERDAGERYGRHRVFDRNLLYYARAPHVELPVPQAARGLPAIRGPRALRAASGGRRTAPAGTVSRSSAWGELRYLNTGSLNLRTLLDPDPERYLQHVVLVANR